MTPPKYPKAEYKWQLHKPTGTYTVQATTHMPCGITLKGTGVALFKDRAENVARERMNDSVRAHIPRCKPHPKRPDLACHKKLR